MFIRSLHNPSNKNFINPFYPKYENKPFANRSFYAQSGPPIPPPQLGLILLGGVLFWYAFVRRV